MFAISGRQSIADRTDGVIKSAEVAGPVFTESATREGIEKIMESPAFQQLRDRAERSASESATSVGNSR